MLKNMLLLKVFSRKCGATSLQKITVIGICLFGLFLFIQYRNETEAPAARIDFRNFLVDPSLKDTDANGHVFKARRRVAQSNIVLGEQFPNCGLDLPCGENAVPVYIYTGKNSSDEPKLCINSRYVIRKDLNGGGRGLNLAVVEPESFQVIHVRNFDTYEKDDTQLEMFLEKYVLLGDIIIIFTFDEASGKLSEIAKKMLYELGSASIQNLKFRSSWYMVSQKGIEGFSPYEKLSINTDSSAWAKLLETNVCLPSKLQGRIIQPDASAQSNSERRQFCTKNVGYGDFCDGLTVDEPLYAAPLANVSLRGHPIFAVPIAVLAGFAHHYVALTLETLLRQPGINPKMVTVYYMKPFVEIAELAALFQFRASPISQYETYKDQIEFVYESTWQNFPNADHVIILEEDLVLAPDFLFFMSQLLPLLGKDPTLYSVSSWNDNGYMGVSSDPNVTYRVEGFPGLGYMISKTTYVREMKGKMKDCCHLRPWEGWTLSSWHKPEMVIPDISRAHHGLYEGLGRKTNMLEHLFNRMRNTNMESRSWLENADRLLHDSYEHDVEEMIKKAIVLEMTEQQLLQCVAPHSGKPTLSTLSKIERQPFVLYFSQKSDIDFDTLRLICQCFGLFHDSVERPRGLHNGMLRFTLQKHPVFLVGSTSLYARYKPINHPFLAVSLAASPNSTKAN